MPDVADHIRKWWEEDSDSDNEIKWQTLEHNGVWFPPDYVPHGVKILYDGKPVALTPPQEEAATFYAVMLESDYVKNPTFNKNFFHDWRKLLGKDHTIKELAKCDFTPIFKYMNEQKELKKQMTLEEKKVRPSGLFDVLVDCACGWWVVRWAVAFAGGGIVARGDCPGHRQGGGD